MITAKEAKNKTFESNRMKEVLKEKRYEEICEIISNHIRKQTERGYYFADLNTSFMYPFRDRIISELKHNGYEVELYPVSDFLQEYLLINWR